MHIGPSISISIISKPPNCRMLWGGGGGTVNRRQLRITEVKQWQQLTLTHGLIAVGVISPVITHSTAQCYDRNSKTTNINCGNSFNLVK